MHLPVIRWGQPYQSLDVQPVNHFYTGEAIAEVGQANAGIIQRDMRRASSARAALKRLSIDELLQRIAQAAELYEHRSLPVGDATQSAEQFVRHQSASTGLPEHMCRANMAKNSFVLRNLSEILDSLTRGLDPRILERGFGMESRSVIVSYQCQSPVVGAVLPSNSPGVHTLWLPVPALQVGLVLKPGPQEPWTPYRMFAAMTEAGIPPEAFAIYPGGPEAGAAVVSACPRVMIFGGTATVDMYRGNPHVQAHGPGFSKVLLGDDLVDRWEDYLDLMAASVYANSGRGCINASGIWASRHTEEIAEALAARLGPVEVLPPENPEAGLAAFTVPGAGPAIWKAIEADFKEPSVTHSTAAYGPRLVEMDHCSYLRPTIVHCSSPDAAIAKKEFMFPFASVVKCPQTEMIARIGPTLVASAITHDRQWIDQLVDATNIDRLNIGAIPTHQLNWLQPHEGNLIEFLFRNRAVQVDREELLGQGQSHHQPIHAGKS